MSWTAWLMAWETTLAGLIASAAALITAIAAWRRAGKNGRNGPVR